MKTCSIIVFMVLTLAATAQPAISDPIQVAIQDPWGNVRPRIALNAANMPVVIWTDGNAGNVYSSVKTETGFSAPQKLNPNGMSISAFDWSGPEIASSGNHVYVVMKRTPEMTESVYIVKSDDGGSSWSDTIRVETSQPFMSRMPSVGVDTDGNPVVAFMRQDMSAFSEWTVAKSLDGGVSFMPPVSASVAYTDEVCDCCPSVVAINDVHTAVIYRNNESNLRDIRASLSSNQGADFSVQADIDDLDWVISACPSSGPSVILTGDILHSAWMSVADGNTRIYYSAHDMASGTFGGSQMVLDGSAGMIQNFPSLAGDASVKAIAWETLVSGQRNIQLAYSSAPTGFETSPLIDLTADMPANQTKPHLTYAAGVFHLVYTDGGGDAVIYQTIGNLTSVAPGPVGSVPVLYPNPCTSGMLSFTAPWPIASARLTDMASRTVQSIQAPGPGTSSMPTADIPSGLYTLILTGVEGKKYVEKVIIEQ